MDKLNVCNKAVPQLVSTLRFTATPGQALPNNTMGERASAFVKYYGTHVRRMMDHIITWAPTFGRIAKIRLYLLHVRGKGATVKLMAYDTSGNNLFWAPGPESGKSNGSTGHPELVKRVAGEWTALCKYAKLAPADMDTPVMLVLTAQTGTRMARHIAMQQMWSEDEIPTAWRQYVDQYYADRPGDSVEHPTDGFNPIRVEGSGPVRETPEERARSVAFIKLFEPWAKAWVEAAVTWRRGELVTGLIVVLVDCPKGRAAVTLVSGRNGTHLDAVQSVAKQPPHVLQDKVADLWGGVCASVQARPPALLLTMPDVDLANPYAWATPLWDDASALRVAGRNLSQLYTDVSSPHPMGMFRGSDT